MDLKSDVLLLRSSIAKAFCEIKRAASIKAQASGDIMKMLYYAAQTGDLIVVPTNLDTLYLEAVIELLKEKYGPPVFVLFCSDAVTSTAPMSTNVSAIKRGELVEAFNAGNPNVGECLHFSFATSNTSVGTAIGYMWDSELNDIIFGVENIHELEWKELAIDGVVPKALQVAFTDVQ